MPTAAIVGASSKRDKFGNKAVRAYLKQGWTVYPVHPSEKRIEGLEVVARVADLPEGLDRIAFYVAPAAGLTLLEEIAKRRPGHLFLNPGTSSPELVERARELSLPVRTGCAIVDIGESPGDY